MKTQMVEKTVALNESLSARLVIKRVGQEEPGSNDQIRVSAHILLPCSDLPHRPGYIHQDIQFNKRVCVCSHPLEWNWGFKREGEEGRWNGRDFVSKTWKDAFIQAEVYLENEIQILIDALEKRAKALEAAEKK